MNSAAYNTVNELIKRNKLPHAILIDSGSDANRNELALHIASAFVCENSNHCGLCSPCQKVKNSSHPDVITFDPELIGKKIFPVDTVREIRNDAYILPNESKYKVYLIKNADKMTVQAQNAFLKILEEPPSYARFILLCKSRSVMIETIMSRVTPFSLGAEDYSANDDYAQKADDLANKLAIALSAVTELEFMRLTAAFEKDKELFAPTLSYLQLIFRDAVALSTGSSITFTNHSDTARLLTSKLSIKTLIELTEKTEHFFECINKNANKNLLITRFCSVLRDTAYGC